MWLIVFSVLFFVVVIIVAHFFVPEEYHWTKNTISDLAAQGLPYQWIMQMGFIGFGALLSVGLIWKAYIAQRISVVDLFLIVYALSVMLSGFFSAEPFLPGVSHSEIEHVWHSRFATWAGIAFSIAIVWQIFTTDAPNQRLFHIVFLILVMGFSAVFGLDEGGVIEIGKGVFQRGLYTVSFIWLLTAQYWEYSIAIK